MLKLQLVEDPERYVKLTTLPITIGRDKGNDLAVDDASISDFHAEVSESAGEVFVADLLSASGTFVNEQRVVAPTRLCAWDVIRIGTVRCEVYDPNTPRPDHWALRSESDLLAGQFYTLGEKTVIGRDAECDLAIDWYLLSRRHAQLTIEGDHLRVEDLGSRNGTFVNGQQVEQGVARSGDEIRFDEQRFIVVGPDEQFQGDIDEDDKTRLRGFDPDQTRLAMEPQQSIDAGPSAEDDQDEPVASSEAGTGVSNPAIAESVDDERTVLLGMAAEIDIDAEPTSGAFLREQVAGGETETWPLTEAGSSIGRAQDNDIVLGHEGVSKQHALLFSRAGGWYILDKDSRNGVKVNGEPIGEQQLHNGDWIALGVGRFQFHCEAMQASDEDATVLFSVEPQDEETRIFEAPAGDAPGHGKPNGAAGAQNTEKTGRKGEWIAGTLLFLVLAAAAGALYLWRAGSVPG